MVHYYTYEWASFIADVGGFLGLLLGYSVLREDTCMKSELGGRPKRYRQVFSLIPIVDISLKCGWLGRSLGM